MRFGGSVDSLIKSADLFVGIITINSRNSENTLNEWQIAKRNNIKSLLILEKGVKLRPHPTGLNVVEIDRRNPDEAVNKLKSIKENLMFAKPLRKVRPTLGKDDVLTVVAVGVVLLSVAVLVAMLASGSKSRR